LIKQFLKKKIKSEELTYTEFEKLKEEYEIEDDEVLYYISKNEINKDIAFEFMNDEDLINEIADGTYDSDLTIEMFEKYSDIFFTFVKDITMFEKYRLLEGDRIIFIRIKFKTKHKIVFYSNKEQFEILFLKYKNTEI